MEKITEQLLKIKPTYAITILFVICGAIAPSYLFLFIYSRNLFMSLDLIRLTIIAISICSPIFIFNTLLVIIIILGDKKEPSMHDEKFQNARLDSIYFGSILTVFSFGTSILMGYYSKYPLTHGVAIILLFEIILLIFLWFTIFRKR